MTRLLRSALALLCAAALSVATSAETLITPAQLRDDLRALRQAVAEIHPEPGFSADPLRLEAAYAALDAELAALPAGLSRAQAWQRFARLNPVFEDAHWLVFEPDWRGQLQAHLATGGGLFPFELQIEAGGAARLRERLGGGASPWAGARLLSVNGRPMDALRDELMALMHGDTPALRAELLSQRFAYLLWRTQGTPPSWQLELEQRGRRHRLSLAPSGAQPLMLQRSLDFDAAHQFSLLPGKQALLTLHSFWWPDKARYFAFLDQVFAQLRTAGTETLIIDIRANPGGDDDQWKRGLLTRIAGQPYRAGSRFVKRVLPGRAGPGERVGSTVPGEIQGWEPAAADGPQRFRGKVYVLVGRGSYSSAILFANTVQDFGFATLVGGPGISRTRQSGGVLTRQLPNSGLELSLPRFILTRPSGQTEPIYLTPDLRLDDEALRPDALVERLRRGLGG